MLTRFSRLAYLIGGQAGEPDDGGSEPGEHEKPGAEAWAHNDAGADGDGGSAQEEAAGSKADQLPQVQGAPQREQEQQDALQQEQELRAPPQIHSHAQRLRPSRRQLLQASRKQQQTDSSLRSS